MNRTIVVEVHPRSKERSIMRKDDGVYKIRTTSTAEHGRANKDVVDILAEYLGIAKSRIVIHLGHASRRKIIKIMA